MLNYATSLTTLSFSSFVLSPRFYLKSIEYIESSFDKETDLKTERVSEFENFDCRNLLHIFEIVVTLSRQSSCSSSRDACSFDVVIIRYDVT